MTRVLDVGDRTQLVMDDRFVHASRGVDWQLQSPLKDRLVLQPESDEGRREFQISTVIEHEGRYLLYYLTFHEGPPARTPKGTRHLMRVAVSEDGVHWERPRVGIIDVGDGDSNNIVMAGGMGTVFRDPNEALGYPLWWAGHLNENPWWAESRGAVYTHGPGKVGAIYLCHSEDGLHWHRQPEPILPFWCDTRNQVFFDSQRGKYAAYLRCRPGGHPHRAVCRAESDSLLDGWEFAANPERPADERGLHGWIETELPVVMAADENDPANTGLYTPNVHPYHYAEDAYVAFPETYRCRDGQESFGRDARGQPVNEGPLDVSLAVSRDGIQWHRFRQPYVPLGRRGELDAGTIYMGVGMLRRGDELWQYCAVSPHTHHGRHQTLPGSDGGIRLLRQRLDGFVALQAGAETGEFVTPPLTVHGSRLWLNADCSALGEVWVELQTASGAPIPGYTLSDAVSVDMNAIDHLVWWRTGPDIRVAGNAPIRMRVRMHHARLFAFRFGEDSR